MDLIEFVNEPLNIDVSLNFVHEDSCGAVASFRGPTRNHSLGKKVLRLEYEAYEPMALKQTSQICNDVRDKWPSIVKIAVRQRTGACYVGESGIDIAVSSPHRKDALEACHFIIDEVKASVAVWKQEFYEDGSVWKENIEFDPSKFIRKTNCSCVQTQHVE